MSGHVAISVHPETCNEVFVEALPNRPNKPLKAGDQKLFSAVQTEEMRCVQVWHIVFGVDIKISFRRDINTITQFSILTIKFSICTKPRQSDLVGIR